MTTFLMFGKYSSEAVKGISTQRTSKSNSLIKKLGGKVHAMYALMGEKDLLLIVSFPGVEQAMKASVALSKLSGIAFTSVPAVTVDKFDKLIRK
jgi:uncharacterized protein with GYD domain